MVSMTDNVHELRPKTGDSEKITIPSAMSTSATST
jgi:hypothetical protein